MQVQIFLLVLCIKSIWTDSYIALDVKPDSQKTTTSFNYHHNESVSNIEPKLLLSTTYSNLKIINKTNSNKNKNNLYAPMLIHNFQENESLNQNLVNDLNKFGAYSKLVSQLMNSIMNKELAFADMQQKLDKAQTKVSMLDFENIIDTIFEKMTRKIQDVHSAIEVIGEKIQEIYESRLISNFTTATTTNGCCDFYDQRSSAEYKMDEFMKTYSYNTEYDGKLFSEIKLKEQQIKNEKYHFDKRFNSWINEEYSCDIGGHSDRFDMFDPSGTNLTNEFRMNLAENPNIKWQYYMSLMGRHIEYPSYLPSNNYCFLHNLINKSQSNVEFDRLLFTNGFSKRFGKLKNKKHDWFYHHRKAYMDLNQLFRERHLENLFTTVLPQSKLVIIVIDRGSALTDHQLNIAKSIAKYILNSLSHRDKVGIVDLSSNVYYPSSETCSSNLELAHANYDTKHFYGRYIDDIERSYNSTNHYLGFKKAFQVISTNYFSFKNDIGKEPEIFIAYISRGLLASLADAKPVMQLISDELNNRPYSFVINTFALIDERIPIMLETIFLKEIATMNFKKFKVNPPENKQINNGMMIALNSTENLSQILNGIYNVLSKTSYESHSNLYVSLPHYDFISKDTYVSISKAFYYQNRLLGVVGVDLSFFDLAEDIIHYDYSDSYAFMMDAHSGKLLFHPAFVHYFRNNFKQQNKFNSIWNYDDYIQNSFINVEHVEQVSQFYPNVKLMMMNNSSGTYTINLNEKNFFKPNQTENVWWNDRLLERYSTIVYHWRRIHSSAYIVVIASYNLCDHCRQIPSNNEPSSLIKHLTLWYNQHDQSKFVSHRLDYPNSNQHVKLCKHFNQLATLDTATLYLSPNAFIDHYKFEVEGDSYENVHRYMDYLTDNTDTVPNPGLSGNVKPDVITFNFLIDFWKNTLETSETSKYIVRKYIATVSGTFLLYPGSLMDQSFQPKTRAWYSRAISNPGKMIFTPPYIDVGGSGYIVTISQAIYQRKANGFHSNGDNVWAVMAIDLTLGYFHKIIDEMVPICAKRKASCFIMDDYGYLIVHSSFSKPSLTPFIERQHITHKEPHMMNHLLNHKNFVRKLVCNSYTDKTIQRYYMFNTSLTGIVTNIVKNENSSCTKYNVVSLDQTNAFFGIVDHSCDNFTTFCPCSLTDRLCLNCHRMEQTDCECPCECPLVMNLCNGQLIEKEDKHPICSASSDRLKEPNVPKHLFESLNTCINNECFNKHSESECKGILGCEWCSMENGLPLKKPFCTNQNLCFGGIYGSKNPITNNFYFHRNENYKTFQSAPIGPLTTTLIICFIILTFSVYCFHFQTNRSLGARLNSAHNDHQILQSPNDVMDIIENEYCNDNNHMEQAVASFVQVPVNSNYSNLLSPYQYNSNYRMRAETESDFGYSTMTPNDESQLNGSIYINPEIIRSNRKTHPKSNESRSSIGSMTSNEESSSVISSPSVLSANDSNSRLPPPPSKIRTSKNRSKQKFINQKPSKLREDNKMKCNLPTVDEKQPLDEVIS